MAAIEQIQFGASIISTVFCRLGEQVEEAMKAGIRLIHMDIMDGLLVPNLDMGPDVALQPLKNKYVAQIHAHLMITDPDRYITNFVHAGADGIKVNVEACPQCCFVHKTTFMNTLTQLTSVKVTVVLNSE